MGIKVVKENVRPIDKIKTCDLSNAQVWSNHNGTTIMTIPSALSRTKGFYFVLDVSPTGGVKHSCTMKTLELVNHLNEFSYEEINCTIELDF